MNSYKMTVASRFDALLEALANGKPSREAHEALWLAAQVWYLSGGGLPLERFAGFGATGASLAKASRDVWLRRAAKGLPGDTEFKRAHELAAELNIFITRGPWRTWCQEKQPPEGSSKLRTALFHIAKHNEGNPLSVQTIYRALSKSETVL